MENVNWLSMVIATLIPSVVGFIFYSKPLFGKMWMEAIGMTEEKVKQGNMPLIMGVSLLMSFILSFFLINFNNMPGQEGAFDSFGHGAFHGVFITIVVIMPVLVTKGLYEQATWKGILLGLVYWAISAALMGGVLDAMNHWPNEAPAIM